MYRHKLNNNNLAMNKITMCCPMVILSEDGSIMLLFRLQEQFDFESIESRIVTEINAEPQDLGIKMRHYKVIRNDKIFWIPENYCAEYGIPYHESVFDKRNHEYLKYSNDEAKNCTQLYKDMLGRKIDNSIKIEYSYLYNLLINAKSTRRSSPGA